MPHASDDELRQGPVGTLLGRLLFGFYALVIIATPVLFISFFVKYG